MLDFKNIFHFLIRLKARQLDRHFSDEFTSDFSSYDLDKLNSVTLNSTIELSNLSSATKSGVEYISIGTQKSSSNKQIALLWNFGSWKRPVTCAYLREYETAFVLKNNDVSKLPTLAQKTQIQHHIVWGRSENNQLQSAFAAQSITPYRIEDGFIRSADLGSKFAQPLSLVLDKSGMYFDAERPSDIEKILNTFNLSKNETFLKQSNKLLNLFILLKITKYNMSDLSIQDSFFKTDKKKILVLGQVEDDASIRYGNATGWNNEKLLSLAIEENPSCEILYKPHPEVIRGYRRGKLKQINKISTLVPNHVILADLFKRVDHVYVLTSLSGLEARLHGLKVTTVGSPFYSGWGLCDDRKRVTRRNNKITIEQLFMCAYLLYPRYLLDLENPLQGCLATIFRVVAERKIQTHKALTIKKCKLQLKHLLSSNYWPILLRPKVQRELTPTEIANTSTAIISNSKKEHADKQFFVKMLTTLLSEKATQRRIFTSTQLDQTTRRSSLALTIRDHRNRNCKQDLLLLIETLHKDLSEGNFDTDILLNLCLICLEIDAPESANQILHFHNVIFPFKHLGKAHVLQAISDVMIGNSTDALEAISIACMMDNANLANFETLAPWFETAFGTLPYLTAMKSAWPDAGTNENALSVDPIDGIDQLIPIFFSYLESKHLK